MPSKVGYLQRYLIIIDQVKRNRYISMDKLVDAVRGKIANYVDPDEVGLSKSWYLLAMEIDGRPEEQGCIKTWGVDRIQNLVVTRTKFWKKTDYNIEKEFADSFGIYSDRDKEPEYEGDSAGTSER